MDDYASLLDGSSWSEAAANGVLVIDLLSVRRGGTWRSLKSTALDLELEDDGHNAASPVEAGSWRSSAPNSKRRCGQP